MREHPVSPQEPAEPDPQRVALRSYVWMMAAATFLVAVCPIAVVWSLRSDGIVRSGVSGVLLAIALSLGASRVGSGFWKTRKGSGDILFNELMAWGFVRRWRNERRLASARELLGAISQSGDGADGQPGDRLLALERLGSTLEATDPHTHGHSRRVARHAWMIARHMGLGGESVARIRTAAALHDVGKLHTPSAVLRKPGRLTDAEYEVIKLHPVDGAEMVAALGDGELTAIVRHHHERLDGTGYPDRIAGEQVPLGARIIAVADTFDAITSTRPYRPPRSHKEAMDILKYEAGTQLDPAVVKAFCGIYSGRRTPLALWASLTSLPAQAFSWLGGTAVGAASATQVAAIATIAAVGAVAAPAPAQEPSSSSSAPVMLHALALVSSPVAPHAAGGGAGADRHTGAHNPAGRSRGGATPPKAHARPHVASPPSGAPPVGAAPVATVNAAGSGGGEAPYGGGAVTVASTRPASGKASPPRSATPPASGGGGKAKGEGEKSAHGAEHSGHSEHSEHKEKTEPGEAPEQPKGSEGTEQPKGSEGTEHSEHNEHGKHTEPSEPAEHKEHKEHK